MLLSIAVLVSVLMTSVQAENPFRHHQYKPGEVLNYSYEDTDTIFSAIRRDGTIQAGDSLLVQEIKIPVKIEILSGKNALERNLTILPLAEYRQSAPAALADSPFKALIGLAKNLPRSFSYSYKDDTEALDHLQAIFEKVRKDEVGKFLFFKMQDIHQMQESVEKIPEGIVPGGTKFSSRHERKGLGGDFVAAPVQVIYQGVEILDGVKCGYFKAISMGHEFTSGTMKTLTNFFFTLHVALNGRRQGLMLLGEGQETATVFKESEKEHFEPQVVLQRQFSIRLQ